MTINNMTKEQEIKYQSFKEFYNDNLIKIYTTLIDKDKLRDSDFYQSYLNIIKKIADLLRRLKITDPFYASAMFEYLLWNGYLSKGRKLYYCSKGRVNNLAALGADIMLGASVCLNNAEMLTSVLSHLNIESYFLSCTLDHDERLHLEYKPDIKRRKKPRISLRKSILSDNASSDSESKEANHAFALFKSKDVYYLADPTILAFLNISDILEAQYVGSETSVELNAEMTLFLNSLTPEEFHNLFIEVFNSKDKDKISTDFIRNVYDNVISFCKSNIPILNEFHKEINDDIEVINKTLNKQNNNNILRNNGQKR